MNDQLMIFDDRPKPDHRRADAQAGKAGFADRRIKNPARAEFFEHPFGDLVSAVVLGDFFAHEKHVFVALHLLGHGGTESFS